MNTQEIKRHVEKALNHLLEKDRLLLVNDLNERTISHKLAEKLQKEFTDWDVDCEYNRNFDRIKRANIKRRSSQEVRKDDTDARTVYPDIIIHHRGTEENLVIIEIKKNASNADREDDIEKIESLMEELNYSHGLFIDFATRTDDVGINQIEWFSRNIN